MHVNIFFFWENTNCVRFVVGIACQKNNNKEENKGGMWILEKAG